MVNRNKMIFAIRVSDLQTTAIKNIGRKLTEGELHTATKGVEAGLFFDTETVLKTAIQEAII